MKHFFISDRKVGDSAPPFIIAEMSANHGGDFDRALRIIKSAAESEADAIKFQAYKPESITLDSSKEEFRIKSGELWQGKTLYELYKEACTPYDWFEELFKFARTCGIIPFCSVFDQEGVELMKELDAPAYKIASFEAVDHGLIKQCALTKKPLIISTGLCEEAEIHEAISVAKSCGNEEVALLKCTSAYPAVIGDANLITIPKMRNIFETLVGVSDHTLGTAVSVAACALGADIVEKHVIDDKTKPTADSAFSIEPDELSELVLDCKAASSARGVVQMHPTRNEAENLIYRRSLYSVKRIRKGETISSENVKSIRPGFGLGPKHLNEIIGKVATKDIDAATPISWELIT